MSLHSFVATFVSWFRSLCPSWCWGLWALLVRALLCRELLLAIVGPQRKAVPYATAARVLLVTLSFRSWLALGRVPVPTMSSFGEARITNTRWKVSYCPILVWVPVRHSILLYLESVLWWRHYGACTVSTIPRCGSF